MPYDPDHLIGRNPIYDIQNNPLEYFETRFCGSFYNLFEYVPLSMEMRFGCDQMPYFFHRSDGIPDKQSPDRRSHLYLGVVGRSPDFCDMKYR